MRPGTRPTSRPRQLQLGDGSVCRPVSRGMGCPALTRVGTPQARPLPVSCSFPNFLSSGAATSFPASEMSALQTERALGVPTALSLATLLPTAMVTASSPPRLRSGPRLPHWDVSSGGGGAAWCLPHWDVSSGGGGGCLPGAPLRLRRPHVWSLVLHDEQVVHRERDPPSPPGVTKAKASQKPQLTAPPFWTAPLT